MSLESKFKKAVHVIRTGEPRGDTSTDTKLKYYKYFKQATEGDVQGSQPWAVQVESRAKWDAWNSVKGMAKEEAMRLYVELLTQNDPAWESNPAAATFTE